MNSLAIAAAAARRMSARSSSAVWFQLSQRGGAPLSRSSTPSWSNHRFFSSRSALLDLITREHTEEIEEGRTEIPEQLTDLKKSIREKAWKIVDDEGFTKLVREHNGMKLQLSFHCQDMLHGEEEEPEYHEEGGEEEPVEEDEEPPSSVRFVATATPTKSGKTLVFQCTSEFDHAAIDAVAVSTEDNIEDLHTNDAHHNEYTGPVFSELAEDVREEFHNFLEFDVGVDSELSSFINSYADYKEQQNYVKFLKDVKEVLK